MTPEAEVIQLRHAVEQMQHGLEQLQEDKLLSDREVTRLRREVVARDRMLREAREQDPHAETIRMILAEWKATNGRSDKTCVEAGGTRWERVRTYLKRHPNPQDHIDAIKGQHTPAHIWWPEHDKAEISHVYKDDEWFEKFRKAGAAARENGTVVSVGVMPTMCERPPVRNNIAIPARERMPGDYPMARILRAFPAAQIVARDQWETQCPAHIDSELNLRIGRGSSGRVGLHCVSNDCDLEAILVAVGLDLGDLVLNADADPDRQGFIGVPGVDVEALRLIEGYFLVEHCAVAA